MQFFKELYLQFSKEFSKEFISLLMATILLRGGQVLNEKLLEIPKGWGIHCLFYAAKMGEETQALPQKHSISCHYTVSLFPWS